MRILKKLKIFLIISIFLLISSCKTIVVKIDEVKNFSDQYLSIDKNIPEEEIGKEILKTAKEEINYLRMYIEILINRIKAADQNRIEIIDNSKLEKSNDSN